VRARNIYGYGDFSSVTERMTSDVPDQIEIATIAIVGTDAVIDWDEPDSNYSPLTAYEIVFKDVDGNLKQ
jgi:hypothetical protein